MAVVGDLVINLVGKNDSLSEMIRQSKSGLLGLSVQAEQAALASSKSIVSSTKKAVVATSELHTSLAKVADQLKAGFSVDALVSLGARTILPLAGIAGVAKLAGYYLEAAQHAKSLRIESEKFGIGTTMLQQMQRSAARLGIDSGAITSGVAKMQKAITEEAFKGAKGDDSTFKRLGLSSKELIESSPEEALNKTAKAIMGVGNEATRTYFAIKLFGRGGQELIPILKDIAEGRISGRQGIFDQSQASLWGQEKGLDAWSLTKKFAKLPFQAMSEYNAAVMQGIGIIPGNRDLAIQNRQRERDRIASNKAQAAVEKQLAAEEARKAAAQRAQDEQAAWLKRKEHERESLLYGAEAVGDKWTQDAAVRGRMESFRTTNPTASDREIALRADLERRRLEMQAKGVSEEHIGMAIRPLEERVPGVARQQAGEDAVAKLRKLRQEIGGLKELGGKSPVTDWDKDFAAFLADGNTAQKARELANSMRELRQGAQSDKSIFDLTEQLQRLDEELAGVTEKTRLYNALRREGRTDEQATKESGLQEQIRQKRLALDITKQTESPWEKMTKDLGELESVKGELGVHAYERRKQAILDQAYTGVQLTPEEKQAQAKQRFGTAIEGLAVGFSTGKIDKQTYEMGKQMELRKYVDEQMGMVPAVESFGAQERGSTEAWHSIIGAMNAGQQKTEKEQLTEAAKKQMDAATALERAGQAIAGSVEEYDPFE